MARAKRIRTVSLRELPLGAFLLTAFLLCGVLLGYGFAQSCAEETGGELRRYFDDYCLLASQSGLSTAAVMRTLFCYFRAPLFAFLLGFASIGVFLIPLLCVFEGFLFSFSLITFAATLGKESFALLLALFAIRMLFVLPAALIVGSAALERAKALALFSIGSGKRVRPVGDAPSYWYRFGIVCVCLLFGSLLELWLVPQFLSLAGAS